MNDKIKGVPMINLLFRKAVPEDLNEVTAMYLAAICEMRRNGIEQWDEIYPNRSTLENDITADQLMLGLTDNVIASAYVLNHEFDTEYTFGAFEGHGLTFTVIHRLCVSPAFQNKGVGSATLRFIEEQVLEQGIDSIRLDAFSKNPYALKMYDRQGYRKAGTANLRKGEFLLMEKILSAKRMAAPGACVGKGNTADIHLWDDHKVIKLLHTGYPYCNVRTEYSNSLAINHLDFPKPKSYALITYEQRYGIIYDRIEGENLLDNCLRTFDLAFCAGTMAKLHKKILSNHCNTLPDYKEFLRCHAEKAAKKLSFNDEDIRIKITERIALLPEGDNLCHGDFHPGNIIIASSDDNAGTYIIDFMNLCRGPVLYDIARTVNLIQYTPVPKDTQDISSMLAFKKALADKYLEQMNTTREDIAVYMDLISLCRQNECPDM